MQTSGGSGCSTPQRSASGEDSDSDYENENIRPRGLTGLQNLGNTCYLNSACQSLSNCPPLTRYFLDCAQLIRPQKSPMLSRSYLKLITELWHQKRPSYVVPSSVVTGIKAVHPMFRGYTQQDAQEFLRCLMDQLHEELKVEYSDVSEDEDDDVNNGNIGGDQQHSVSGSGNPGGDKVPSLPARRPSYDSLSSQSELDYETCDSGLSSERSSTGDRDAGSSDDNNSDTAQQPVRVRKLSEKLRKSSSVSTGGVEEFYMASNHSVANTKEMKETANLLEKSENGSRRPKNKGAVMEGGDSREQGSPATYVSGATRDVEGQVSACQQTSGVIQREQFAQSSSLPKSPVKRPTPTTRKVKKTRFDSIISQTFDGKILSSVRCLNCETVSTTKETFQDLSLPIPSRDHLHMLHSGYPGGVGGGGGGVSPPKGGTCGEVHQGWMAWMFTWMKSWFVGPTITLQDCLSAFFSADELKGDNMYSCEKCKKLRNGLKYSKVLELPEILSIHLKRFRHEFYSSKISTYISFPLEGLDMEPYMQKGCNGEVTLYDLVAIICHHGTAGGGHYTAYCLNHLNEQWYEFDDQYVTEVDVSQVQNCEAYVLFYRKSNRKMEHLRQKVMEMESMETSILKFYVSKQWVSRFHTFAEPGPITNVDFICKHGGVPPSKVDLVDDLVVEIHQSTWELLYNRFGGGPVCNHLYACKICQSELDKLRQRQKSEKECFIQLNEEFQEEEHNVAVYAISMAWFREWECFVREKTDNPPGPIENSRILMYRNSQPSLRQNSDHGQLSQDMWQFLHRIYGGGPELIIRQATGTTVKHSSSSSSPTPPQQQLQSQPSASSSSVASASSNSSIPWPPQVSSCSSSPCTVSGVHYSAASSSATSPATQTSLSSMSSPGQPIGSLANFNSASVSDVTSKEMAPSQEASDVSTAGSSEALSVSTTDTMECTVEPEKICLASVPESSSLSCQASQEEKDEEKEEETRLPAKEIVSEMNSEIPSKDLNSESSSVTVDKEQSTQKEAVVCPEPPFESPVSAPGLVSNSEGLDCSVVQETTSVQLQPPHHVEQPGTGSGVQGNFMPQESRSARDVSESSSTYSRTIVSESDKASEVPVQRDLNSRSTGAGDRNVEGVPGREDKEGAKADVGEKSAKENNLSSQVVQKEGGKAYGKKKFKKMYVTRI